MAFMEKFITLMNYKSSKVKRFGFHFYDILRTKGFIESFNGKYFVYIYIYIYIYIILYVYIYI